MKKILSVLLAMLILASCCAVTAFANTPSTYKLYGEDFQNEETGFDTSKWTIAVSQNFTDASDYSTEFNIVNDPVVANEGNKVLQVGGETATLEFSNRKENSDWPNTYFKLNGKFSFEFEIYFPASQQGKSFKFINGFDHTGSAINFLGGQLLNFAAQNDTRGNWRLLVRQNPGGETWTDSWFKSDTWYKIRFEYDFKTHTFGVWANNAAVKKSSGGPTAYTYDFSSAASTRFDRVSFPALAGQTYYLDNVKAYQSVCADADVQGFYNEAGEKIEAVDPVKTVFKTTLINRTNVAVDTMLLLTALDETESRLKDVRLISFAGANSEKVVEETFSNLGAGVKIKAIYLDGLTAIAPESIDSTLKTFEIPAASAATDGE